MKLQMKDFGNIKDGTIELNSVTVFISGELGTEEMKPLTLLVAFMLRLENDIKEIYGGSENVNKEIHNGPFAERVIYSRPMFRELLSLIKSTTEITWKGERYNIYIHRLDMPIVFSSVKGSTHIPCRYFLLRYGNCDNAIKDAIQEVNNKQEESIYIIDDIELGLSPTQQKALLLTLLADLSAHKNNHLLFTTHSLYVLSVLTNAVKAGELICCGFNTKLMQDVFPVTSGIDNENITLYEVDKEGFVEKVESTNNLPSDYNALSNALSVEDEVFSKLLDIELLELKK